MELRAQTTSATQTTVLPATNGDLKAAARPPATSSRRVSYSVSLFLALRLLGSLADERRIWGEGDQMGSSKLEDVPELAESDHASEDDEGGPDTTLAGIQGRRRLDADLKLVSTLEIVVLVLSLTFGVCSFPGFVPSTSSTLATGGIRQAGSPR